MQILLSSGAHLSRYLVQCATHHYFRTAVSFVKTRWVRTNSLPTFAHFLKVAAERLGDVPISKGAMDDGAIFAAFIHESRLPINLRPTKWETVMEIFEKYKVRVCVCVCVPMLIPKHDAAVVHPFQSEGESVYATASVCCP